MDFKNQTIENQEVTLDGNSFENCRFRNCRIVFRASGPPFSLVNCGFLDGVEWTFADGAERTVHFLVAAYHGMGKGGRDLVENTFKKIREAKPPNPPTQH